MKKSKGSNMKFLCQVVVCVYSLFGTFSAAKLTGVAEPDNVNDSQKQLQESGDAFLSRLLTSTSYAIGLPVASVDLITDDDVLGMQTTWGNALVSISKTYEGQGYEAAKELADSVLDSAYCYHLGIPVLFKPTLSSGDQTFRTSQEGALSYFVGGNADYPNDKGFALKGWRSFSTYPAAILLLGNVALSMGKVHLTDKYGNVTVVDKTWGFKKKEDGSICILAHHSSVPYSPSTYAT